MRISLSILACCGLFIPTAYASSVNLGHSTCSGVQTFNDNAGLSLSCSGDFSLNGGSLFSDTGIFVSASGNLVLTDFSLTSPRIVLESSSAQLGSNVSIRADSFSLQQSSFSTPLRLPISTPMTGNQLGKGAGGQIQLTNAVGIQLASSSSNANGATILSSTLVPLPASFSMILGGLLSWLLSLKTIKTHKADSER